MQLGRCNFRPDPGRSQLVLDRRVRSDADNLCDLFGRSAPATILTLDFCIADNSRLARFYLIFYVVNTH